MGAEEGSPARYSLDPLRASVFNVTREQFTYTRVADTLPILAQRGLNALWAMRLTFCFWVIHTISLHACTLDNFTLVEPEAPYAM